MIDLNKMTEDQISDAANSGPLGDCERCGAPGDTIDTDYQADEIIPVCWGCCGRSRTASIARHHQAAR